MRKLSFYTVSKCGPESTPEEFTKNICTVVCKKKQITEYICRKAIVDAWEHYSRWLPMHDKEDSLESQEEYIDLVLGGKPKVLSEYRFRKENFTPESIASLLRIMDHCVPVGTSYETELEVQTITEYFNALLHICQTTQQNLEDLDKKEVEIEK